MATLHPGFASGSTPGYSAVLDGSTRIDANCLAAL